VPTLAIGHVVGRRYRVDSTLGSGGMGVVYSATDIQTGREVAIKVLSAAAFTATNLRRFRREAQMASSLENRYLCRVFYLGVEAETPFIVMEKLSGETLRTRLLALGPLDASDAVTVMLQVLEGLSAAHAKGVLHRDVKPANVFVTSPRRASFSIKIIDFGLSKLLPRTAWIPREETPRAEEISAITATNVVPGTPYYLAPEQISGARDLDQRVDVWAAGVTFYEMLIGRRAYQGTAFPMLAMNIARGQLPALSTIRADVPRGIDDVMAQALAKRRDDRFPTAAAFRAALIAEWARFRTEGVARGERLRKFRPEAKTLGPDVAGIESRSAAEAEAPDELTDVDIPIDFDP